MHHPTKSKNKHRECKTGGGAYFACFLGSDDSHTTLPKKHTWWGKVFCGDRAWLAVPYFLLSEKSLHFSALSLISQESHLWGRRGGVSVSNHPAAGILYPPLFPPPLELNYTPPTSRRVFSGVGGVYEIWPPNLSLRKWGVQMCRLYVTCCIQAWSFHTSFFLSDRGWSLQDASL